MKGTDIYVQDLFREVETGTMGFQTKPKAYDIEPKNMDKRVRVFVKQLLPGMVKSAFTVEDIEFAIQVLERHVLRFWPKVIATRNESQIDQVREAVYNTRVQLKLNLAAARKNEERVRVYNDKK